VSNKSEGLFGSINEFFIDGWEANCGTENPWSPKPVGLRNLTLHFAKRRERDNEATDFEMLARLEFNEFNRNMSDNVGCAFNIKLKELAKFAKFKVWFWVSRKEFTKVGRKKNIRSIPSAKQLWAWNKTNVVWAHYTYAFQEKTYDGVSEFSATMDLNHEAEAKQPHISIMVYPSAAAMHYSSFSRYSYLDALADIGGMYTLVAGFFFSFAPLLIKCAKANRGHDTYKTHGILPAVSLSHRNAEELCFLRSLVFSALGITENDYFTSMLVKMASIKQETKI